MSESRIKTTLQPQVRFSWEAELFQNLTWQQLRFQTIEYVSRTLSWHTQCVSSKIQEYLKRSLQWQCPIHLVMNMATSYSCLLLRQHWFSFLLFLLTKPGYPNIKRKYTSKKAKEGESPDYLWGEDKLWCWPQHFLLFFLIHSLSACKFLGNIGPGHQLKTCEKLNP